MALTTSTNKAQYQCNGSVVTFDLAVRILDEDDVVVLLKDTTDGTQITLVKTTNYTIEPISGDYDNGARVTTLTTYSSDFQITLLREVEFDQDLDLEEGGDLPSDGVEDALDKGVMQAQQLDERLDRTLSVPETDPDGLSYSIQSVEERANKLLAFDTNGSVTNVEPVSEGDITVDTNAGLGLSGSQLFGKVDDSTIEFNGSGQHSIKDGGVDTDQLADGAVSLAKQADISSQTVIGRKTAGSGVPEEVTIVGATGILIDDDTLAVESDTAGATQGNIKTYVDTEVASAVSDINAYFICEDSKSSGTDGGTFTSGSWQTRDLTQSAGNLTGASLSSNVITLPAGTYYVEGWASAWQVDLHQTRVRATSGDTGTKVIGSSENHAGAAQSSTKSDFEGVFTLSQESDIELQHQCSTTKATIGYGNDCGFGDNIYSRIVIRAL